MRLVQKEKLKGILFAFLISISIWIFTLMNSEYHFYVKVPLKIVAPEKYSISGRVPEKIDVLISATGWQILNLSVFPKTSNCLINLSQSEIINEKVILTKNDFLKNLSIAANAKALDVNPPSITLDVGVIGEKIVRVEPDIEIYPRDNFIVVGKPILKPDLVVIRGKKEILDKIDEWKTERILLKDVHKPIQLDIPLSDTLRSLVSLSYEQVKLFVDVDLKAEKEIFDIQVTIEGGNLPEGHILEPKYLKATIRSGINKLIASDIISLEAKVSYFEITNDSIGIISPKINLPEGLNLVSLEPPYLYHWKRTRTK